MNTNPLSLRAKRSNLVERTDRLGLKKLMYRYIISRILLVFPTLIGAAALVFLLMRLVPGDISWCASARAAPSFTQQAARQLPRRDRPSTGRGSCNSSISCGGLARLDFGSRYVSRSDTARGSCDDRSRSFTESIVSKGQSSAHRSTVAET